MALAQEDIEQIRLLIKKTLSETPETLNANVRYELDLRERTIRVEEELKHQRELMLEGFKQMEKRFEQGSNTRIVDTIEELTGKKLTAAETNRIVKGPDEIDLVRSGLEETMINSYHAIREELKRNENKVNTPNKNIKKEEKEIGNVESNKKQNPIKKL